MRDNFKDHFFCLLNTIVGKLSRFTSHHSRHIASTITVTFWSKIFAIAWFAKYFAIRCIITWCRIQWLFAIKATKALFVKSLESKSSERNIRTQQNLSMQWWYFLNNFPLKSSYFWISVVQDQDLDFENQWNSKNKKCCKLIYEQTILDLPLIHILRIKKYIIQRSVDFQF